VVAATPKKGSKDWCELLDALVSPPTLEARGAREITFRFSGRAVRASENLDLVGDKARTYLRMHP